MSKCGKANISGDDLPNALATFSPSSVDLDRASSYVPAWVLHVQLLTELRSFDYDI